jgi:DNA-binding NarL/FixJ family response regulator
MTLRLVLVDDQALMREAFRTILESHDIDIVGEAADGDDAVEVVRRTRPDVVLMDVRMPGRDGIDATAELRRTDPDIPVLILTTFDDDEGLYGALSAGARGFLLKNTDVDQLVAGVHRVAAGESVLDPAVTARVIARVGTPSPAPDPRVDELTEREKDVLALLSEGLSNAEIAQRIGSEASTVKTHVSRVLAKLGVRDRVQAVIWAYESGFAPSTRAIG